MGTAPYISEYISLKTSMPDELSLVIKLSSSGIVALRDMSDHTTICSRYVPITTVSYTYLCSPIDEPSG